MKVDQIYSGCLARGAYYIESEGEAAIIDPFRNPEPYLKKAESRGSKIKYIFRTDYEESLIKSEIDLSSEAQSLIIFGPLTKSDHEIYNAVDGEIFELGKIQIMALHTPGHTVHSTSYLLIDEQGKDHALFTGSTLFVGDVGRPDLAQSGNLITEDLAEMLYDSLREKILTLPDDVIIYPGNGVGSSCSMKIGKDASDTLGNQKKLNNTLSAEYSREEFVDEIIFGLLPPPQYYSHNVPAGKANSGSKNDWMRMGKVPLTTTNFEAMIVHDGALVVDTRSHVEFAKAHVPGSVFIGQGDTFINWVKTLVTDSQQPLVFISDKDKEEEVVKLLNEAGFESVHGYLRGGITSWIDSGRAADSIKSISAMEFASEFRMSHLNILDVRNALEFQAEHIDSAQNFPLNEMNDLMNQIQMDKEYYIYCAGGYRSMIAASILQGRGFDNIVNIQGGFGAIAKTHVPITDYVCGSTLDVLRR